MDHHRDPQNRRSYPRRPAKGKVVCRTGKLGMGTPFPGQLLEISPDAIEFRSDREVRQGDELELELSPPGGKSFRSRGLISKASAEGDGWKVVCRFESRLPYHHLVHLAR